MLSFSLPLHRCLSQPRARHEFVTWSLFSRCCSSSTVGEKYFAAERSDTAQRSSLRWRIACWNQHRVEVDQLLRTLRVNYVGSDVHTLLSGCDVFAVQELDEPLREVLRASPRGGRLIESDHHVDGRGVKVDSSVGVMLCNSSDVAVVQEEHAELRKPLKHGQGFAARDHVAVRLQWRSQGNLERDDCSLIVCSVHLHPPNEIGSEAAGDAYVQYLAPLKSMLVKLSGEAGVAELDIVLVGDFNVSAADFNTLTVGDEFWQSFAVVRHDGELTAHQSNPCETGDYMLSREVPRSKKAWQCRAQGPADFAHFERFCDELVADAASRLPWLRTHSHLLRAIENMNRALASAAGDKTFQPKSPSEVQPPPPPPSSLRCSLTSSFRKRERPGPPPRDPAAMDLPAFLQLTVADLGQRCALLEDLWRGSATLQKTLFTSDHRPLVFEEMAVVPDAQPVIAKESSICGTSSPRAALECYERTRDAHSLDSSS